MLEQHQRMQDANCQGIDAQQNINAARVVSRTTVERACLLVMFMFARFRRPGAGAITTFASSPGKARIARGMNMIPAGSFQSHSSW